jgi:DNA-binding GntR family transcriptional regulator
MKPTAAEKAYRQIKELIITIQMPPGSVISEAKLMEDLQIGRTPIREAIKQLQIENLVDITPRRGMFVSEIAVTDLFQIFEIRVELESLAARLATNRITPDQLSKLNNLSERYQKITLNNKEKLINLDKEFHFLIAEASQNKYLRKELEYYYNLSLRIWYLAINSTQPQDIDVSSHIDILKAIQSGDAQRAEQNMKKHIKRFHQTIRQFL